jgi:hypothetical protein
MAPLTGLIFGKPHDESRIKHILIYGRNSRDPSGNTHFFVLHVCCFQTYTNVAPVSAAARSMAPLHVVHASLGPV